MNKLKILFAVAEASPELVRTIMDKWGHLFAD